MVGMAHVWTPDEATRALVLVQPILRDLVADYALLMTAREVRESCRAARGNEGAVSEAEQDAVAAVSIAHDRILELLQELERAGCELCDLDRGVVKFPSPQLGLLGYLVWVLGDQPTVTTWVQVGEPWTARRDVAQLELQRSA